MNSGQASHYVTLSSNNLTEYATYLIVELGVLALSESVAINLEMDTSIVVCLNIVMYSAWIKTGACLFLITFTCNGKVITNHYYLQNNTDKHDNNKKLSITWKTSI